MSKSYCSRPKPALYYTEFRDCKAIGTVNGKVWEDQRRFMLQLLRDLGFGKSKMEQHIQDEIRCFMEKVDDKNGEPLELIQLLAPSVSNNITSLVFGERMKYDDPRRIFLDSVLTKFTKFVNRGFLFLFVPWVGSLLAALGLHSFKQFEELIKELNTYVEKEVEAHEETLDSNNIRDYIDGYIIQMRDEKKRDNKTTSFDEKMLCGNVRILFGAGSSTVSGTLNWAFLILAAYGENQRKIQEEIEDVIGKERQPCWADRLKMPYTQAFLNEVQRWKTIVPINLARYTLEDTAVKNFVIPKGTFVFANLWSAHYDPGYWEEPDKFLPERFLNKDKTGVIKNDAFMPFSVGRRSCPGDVFARIEIFLYVTSILQNYNVNLPKGHKPDFSGTPGFSYEPTPWKAQFVKRT